MNTKMVVQFQSHDELADLLTLLQEKASSNPGWKSVMVAVKNARPLSELCEEEAKKAQEVANKLKSGHCKETDICEESWDSLVNAHQFDNYEAIASAFRSFCSKQ